MGINSIPPNPFPPSTETMGGNSKPYELPIASTTELGGVKIGQGLTINAETGVLINNNPTQYTLPAASAETLGGVKVGSGLAINSETGVLSASANPVDIESNETVVGTYKSKTLYRRVFRLNPDNGNVSLDTTEIYDTAWLEFGWCEFVNGSEIWRIPLPYYGLDGSNTVYFIIIPIVQSHKLKLHCNRNSNGQVVNRNIEVSILYTKYLA